MLAGGLFTKEDPIFVNKETSVLIVRQYAWPPEGLYLHGTHFEGAQIHVTPVWSVLVWVLTRVACKGLSFDDNKSNFVCVVIATIQLRQ